MQTNIHANNGGLIDVRGVAQLLHVAARTVWAMVSSGKIPPPTHRLSRRTVRWDRATIEKWINAGCPSADRFNEMCRDAGTAEGGER